MGCDIGWLQPNATDLARYFLQVWLSIAARACKGALFILTDQKPLCCNRTDCRANRNKNKQTTHGDCNIDDNRDLARKLPPCPTPHTWEPHNGITADGCIWHVPPDVINDAPVPLVCIAALHFPQDVIVTTLERNVEEFTQLGQLRAGSHQTVCRKMHGIDDSKRQTERS